MAQITDHIHPIVVEPQAQFDASLLWGISPLGGAVMYDDRSESVYGPIFDSLSECRLFLTWCDNACVDPADCTPGRLGDLMTEWKRVGVR